jgi:hypothetical protein
MEMKAFVEIQNKIIETNRHYTNVQNKLQLAEREKRRTLLTIADLESAPANTNTYKLIGELKKS